MRERSVRSSPTQPARRPAPAPDDADIAGIYEARLLARGIRSDEFLALRAGTDLPLLPNVTPVRFGRGADVGEVRPIADSEHPGPAPASSDHDAE